MNVITTAPPSRRLAWTVSAVLAIAGLIGLALAPRVAAAIPRTAIQILYGGLAAASLVASAVSRRWVLPLLLAWGAALTVTGGLAPVVWGEQGALVGVLGGLCTAGVVALVFRACRSHNRGVSGRSRGRTEAETG